MFRVEVKLQGVWHALCHCDNLETGKVICNIYPSCQTRIVPGE